MKSKLMRKKFLTMIIFLEILIGGWALVFIAWALWNKPLGPSMQLSDIISAQAASGDNTTGGSAQNIDPSVEGTPESESIVEQLSSIFNQPVKEPLQQKGLCGGPAVMTLLVVGSDQRSTGYQYGLGDSMKLVRVDLTVPSVMVLDLPRDLWVEIPGIADHGVTHAKLNQAYSFGNPGWGFYDGPGEGPGLLARTLELNYGMEGIDNYLALDMQTFENMIDTIGGIDVYINSRIDTNAGLDGANQDYVIEAGYQHLDGELTLRLARDRAPSIFQRARYQNIVLKALQQKLLSPSIIPNLPSLIGQFNGSVQTDLSPSDINQLICIGQKITEENTHFVAFPENMFTSGSTFDPYRNVNTFTLSVDNNLMRSYFSEFMNGTWPSGE